MSVVLVHGLWHAPAHFSLVAARLRAEGRAPVVLGHSYGGSVVTGLTGVAHLVHLAAFVPDDEESAASLSGPAPWAGAAVLRRADGSSEVDPARAVEALYADCSPEVAARATGMLRPQAPGHGRGVPERAAWRDAPSTYVVCAQDRVLDPDVQRRMARRCSRMLEWATSHSPFLSRPDLVVDLLGEVVADLPPGDGAPG